MTEGISNKLKSTLAYQIAAKLDAQDGNANGEISASIWNKFVEDKGGKQIKESISLKSAMNSITTYLVRQAKSAGQTVDTLAQDWLGKVKSSETPASGETKKSGGTQQAGGAAAKKKTAPAETKKTQQSATTPPAKAPFWDVPKNKTFPAPTRIPYNDPNPPIMSDPKMKGKPDSEVKQKDGTTYCYDSDGRLESIENSKGQEIQYFSYNDDGSIEDYTRYEYDAKGNNTRTVFYTPKGVVSQYEDSTYNSDNYLTSTIYRNPDGRVSECNHWGGAPSYYSEYNADGEKARTVYYNSDGSVKSYYDIEYDANGKETRTVSRDSNGNVTEYSVYEYDKDGNYTGSTCYNPDGTKQE